MPYLPKRKMPMVFSTHQAIEMTGMSPHTFIRYRELLGIEPRRMAGVRGQFYLWPEVVQIMNMRVPKKSVYRRKVLERYDALRKAGLDKLQGDMDEV